MLSYDSEKLSSIINIQRFWRRCLYNRITQYNDCVAENTEDPFTYDSIDEIPLSHKFGYKDSNGHIYIFNAIELEYFIRISPAAACNPYTKEEIPVSVITHLNMFIDYNHLQKKQKQDIIWQTNLQAYTDVSQSMERAGFYTDVCWFNKLTYSICKNVIKLYRDLCRNVQYGSIYFPTEFEIDADNYVHRFCRECILLFKDSDEHYMLCCNFMKALAMNIDEFYQNLPSWLLNVESQLPVHNNRFLYVYMQSIIDNFADNADIDDDEALDRYTYRMSGGLSRAMFYGMF